MKGLRDLKMVRQEDAGYPPEFIHNLLFLWESVWMYTGRTMDALESLTLQLGVSHEYKKGLSYIFDTKPISFYPLEQDLPSQENCDSRNRRILVEEDEVDFLTTWFTSAQVLTSGFFPRLKTLDLICSSSPLSALGISQLFRHLVPGQQEGSCTEPHDVARILDRITITTPYIPSHMRSMHGQVIYLHIIYPSEIADQMFDEKQAIPRVCKVLHLVGLDGVSCSCSDVDILTHVPKVMMDMYMAELHGQGYFPR